jgi:hypothetical protein
MSSNSDFTDVATGHEYVSLLIKKLSDTATVKYDTVDHEFSTVGYPVFETPLQDLINAYRRAFQQLSTLQQGRYAYAQDWNVLADYAKAIINVLVDQLNKLIAKGNRRYMRAYGMLLECHRILSTYKYLKTGDVIMPEHTNTLIDVAKCLEFAIKLLLTKAIVKRREVDTAVGLHQADCSRSEIDVAKGLERDRFPPLIVLVDTDDWETASRWITDGTIVFVNYGTTAMTPGDVRNIVENKEVVFAVLIDTQPYYKAQAGAFYNVFYIETNPEPCHPRGYLLLKGEEFQKRFGFTGCIYFSYVSTYFDYQVKKEHKRSNTVLYAEDSRVQDCGYSYVRYNRGAIIELPYDGTWETVDRLDWTIGMVAHTLLREPDNCHIAFNNVKLRHIVWMASYTSSLPYGCRTADACLRTLADRARLVVIDLRRRR